MAVGQGHKGHGSLPDLAQHRLCTPLTAASWLGGWGALTSTPSSAQTGPMPFCTSQQPNPFLDACSSPQVHSWVGKERRRGQNPGLLSGASWYPRLPECRQRRQSFQRCPAVLTPAGGRVAALAAGAGERHSYFPPLFALMEMARLMISPLQYGISRSAQGWVGLALLPGISLAPHPTFKGRQTEDAWEMCFPMCPDSSGPGQSARGLEEQ